MKKITMSVLCLLLAVIMLVSTGCAGKTPTETTKAAAKTTAVTTGGTTPPETTTPVDPAAEQARFDEFIENLFVNEISLDTLTLHYTVSDPSVYGLENMEPRWEASDEDDKYPVEKIVEILDGFDPSVLTDSQKLTYRVLRLYIKQSQKFDDDRFKYMGSSFDVGSGLQSAIPTNLAEYDFQREKDITDFIALVDQLPEFIDSAIDDEKERVDNGFGFPDEVIDMIIDQCKEIYDGEGDFYLIDVFAEKANKLDFIDDAKKSDYIEKAKKAINEKMLPAFKKIADSFEGFKGKAKNEYGLAGFEGGADYYQLLAQHASSTTLTCKEMISALKQDYDKLYAELYSIYQTNSKLYMDFVNGKYVLGGDSTPTEIVDKLREMIKTDFPAIEGETYELDAMPEAMQNVMSTVLAYYVTPQIENYLHGKIRINPSTLDDEETFSTLAHEGFPGHMYQTVSFYNTNPAKIRKLLSFPGYTEGWAVYAENYIYGLYKFEGLDNGTANALARLFIINYRLSRNAQCRMDIGINYEGWTVGELKKYLDDSGFDSSAAEEIYYQFIGMPGTLLEYYMGYLRLDNMYNKAKQTLAAKFSPTEFHKVILETGPCYLDIVEEAVDEYIEKNK